MLLIPNGVVNDLDSEYHACRFSIQVRKYVSVISLIILLAFFSIVSLISDFTKLDRTRL